MLLQLIAIVSLGIIVLPSIRNSEIWIVRVIALSTLLISIHAIGQYLFIFPFESRSTFGSRTTGPFSNPNHIAAFLTPSLTILFVVLIKNAFTMIKYYYFMILLLGYAALIISGTRGALYSFGFAILFILIILLIYHANVLYKSISTIVLLFFCFSIITYLIFKPTIYRHPTEPSPQERIKSTQEFMHMNSAKDFSIKERAFIWYISKEIIRDNLFLGVSFGSFEYAFKSYKEYLQKDSHFNQIFPPDIFRNNHKYAHNEYLHIWAETGIIGLLLFLICFISLLSNLFHHQILKYHITSIAFLASLMSIFVLSIVSYPLHITASSVLFWSNFGLLLRYSKNQF